MLLYAAGIIPVVRRDESDLHDVHPLGWAPTCPRCFAPPIVPSAPPKLVLRALHGAARAPPARPASKHGTARTWSRHDVVIRRTPAIHHSMRDKCHVLTRLPVCPNRRRLSSQQR